LHQNRILIAANFVLFFVHFFQALVDFNAFLALNPKYVSILLAPQAIAVIINLTQTLSKFDLPRFQLAENLAQLFGVFLFDTVCVSCKRPEFGQ